jgi:hypothetical protein
MLRRSKSSKYEVVAPKEEEGKQEEQDKITCRPKGKACRTNKSTVIMTRSVF